MAYVVVVIGFPIGAMLNATEGVTTTINVCPQLLEGTLEREVSIFATTSDMSARGGCGCDSCLSSRMIFISI